MMMRDIFVRHHVGLQSICIAMLALTWINRRNFGRSGGRVVPADGSETPRVTLTMVESKDTEVIFVAKEVAGAAALSVRDRFVDR